jgi:hypothetical protein
MAAHAYQRAATLRAAADDAEYGAVPLLGVACTASIITDRTKRSDHRCVVAVQRADGIRTYDLTLLKDQRSRDEEEQVVSALVLYAIVHGCDLNMPVPLVLHEGEKVDINETPADDPVTLLLNSKIETAAIHPTGHVERNARVRGAILSGAFNPLHPGHELLAQKAADRLNMPVVFEISVLNADKGALITEEVYRRVRQFSGKHTLLLTREPLFVSKAALFPGCVFIVGYDTAIRLITPRYYGGEEGMHRALEQIRAAGCRFLVAGRKQDEEFRTLAQVAIPPEFLDLFDELPASEFRVDISSTELRQRAQQ